MIRRLSASLVGTVTAAIGIAAAATLLSTSPAFACSCVAPTATVKPAPGLSVFTGTVSRIDAYQRGDSTLHYEAVHFMVDTVYQGDVGADQLVANLIGCGYDFVVGERYTIITEPLPYGGPLSVSACGGASLGGINPVVYGLTSGAPPPAPGRRWPWGVLSAAFVGTVLIVASGLLIGRRRATRR